MSTEKFHHFGASFGVILAIFISSLASSSTDLKRPEEVWVIRSVLDKQPRMLTLALDSACYIAYNLTRCQLYKAWKGGVSLDGAPYTDKKEIQPSSWGASYWIDSTQTNRWKAEKNGIEFLLPADTRHTAEFRDEAPTECTAVWGEGGAIPDDREGIDIGDKAIEEFSKKIAEAGTIIWNGPMGVFEKRGFDIGTKAVGKAIEAMLGDLSGKSADWLIKDRRQKFLGMGSKGLAA